MISLAEGIAFLVRSRGAWDVQYNAGQSGNLNGSIAWIIVGIALTVICSVTFAIAVPIIAAIALPA